MRCCIWISDEKQDSGPRIFMVPMRIFRHWSFWNIWIRLWKSRIRAFSWSHRRMAYGRSLQTVWKMIIWDLTINGVGAGQKIFFLIWKRSPWKDGIIMISWRFPWCMRTVNIMYWLLEKEMWVRWGSFWKSFRDLPSRRMLSCVRHMVIWCCILVWRWLRRMEISCQNWKRISMISMNFICLVLLCMRWMEIQMVLNGSSLPAMMRMWLHFFVKQRNRRRRFLRYVIFHRCLMTVTRLVCLLQENIRKFLTVTVESMADRVLWMPGRKRLFM